MLALALTKGKGPFDLGGIARKEEISEKYLSQIIIPLKARGLVTTFRGAHGGYTLSRPASEITLREIVQAIEGEIALVDCANTPEICGRANHCVTKDVWCELSSIIGDYLGSWTLEKLAAKYHEKNGSDADTYSI
jgi:Rrf2 family protein